MYAEEAETIKKRALITGVSGQDGAYLARFLLDKGYEIFGTFRSPSILNLWRLRYLDIFDRIHLLPQTPNYLSDTFSLAEAIQASEPDEVYHLAAQSSVSASFKDPIGAGDIAGLAVVRVLEAIRETNPRIRLYQASTSEMYGTVNFVLRDENIPLRPLSPYAAARAYAYWMTQIYRDGYRMFVSNGILFNHESPLRDLQFVTRKISNAVAKIALGLENELTLGNLKTKRDWGYAPEYVKAMWLMLQQEEPSDYVIATNEAHSLQEFVTEAFSCVGLDWEKYTKTGEQLFRPLDIALTRGDYSKAKQELGWEPRVRFKELVRIMVEEDLNRWQRWLRGEKFPWDISEPSRAAS